MRNYALGAAEQEGRCGSCTCAAGAGIGIEGERGQVGGEDFDLYGVVCDCVGILI